MTMDGQRFDQLTKALGPQTSRRAAIRALMGAVGAGVLATIGSRTVEAACTTYGRICAAGGECCSGNCVGGTCACAAGKTRCGTQCVDLRYDEAHCGACNVPCAAGLSCREGVCSCSTYRAACTTGDTSCSKNCVDGTCGCGNGKTRCGPRYVDTGSDKAHCGACDTPCPEGLTCKQGVCSCSWLSGACTIDANCCSKTCANGRCVCPAGQTSCYGYCSDTSADITNCGRCDGGVCRNCPAGQTEVNGQCVA
jgi:hypothetical protein